MRLIINSLIAFGICTSIPTFLFSQLNQTDSKGRKQGEWIKHYEGEYENVIRYKGQFKNDKPVGKFVFYWPNTKVKAIMLHEENSDRTEAYLYHDNEQLASHGIYRNGKKDSIWINFNAFGYYSSQESFKNDVLDGDRYLFYGGEILDDKKIKLVLRKETYKNGVAEGEFIEYFPDGVVKSKATYVKGVKTGTAITYHPNGKPMLEEYYKNSKKHGLWKTYDEKGQEIGRLYYKNGVLLEGEKLEKHLKDLKERGISPYE